MNSKCGIRQPRKAVDDARLTGELLLYQLDHFSCQVFRFLHLHLVFEIGTIKTLHKPSSRKKNTELNKSELGKFSYSLHVIITFHYNIVQTF